MKVVHLADSHFDEKRDLADNVSVHGAALNSIADDAPDLIVHAGDLHNRRSSPEVRLAAADFLGELAEIAPVVLIRGNHDVPKDLDLYDRLQGGHPLHVIGSRPPLPGC